MPAAGRPCPVGGLPEGAAHQAGVAASRLVNQAHTGCQELSQPGVAARRGSVPGAARRGSVPGVAASRLVNQEHGVPGATSPSPSQSHRWAGSPSPSHSPSCRWTGTTTCPLPKLGPRAWTPHPAASSISTTSGACVHSIIHCACMASFISNTSGARVHRQRARQAAVVRAVCILSLEPVVCAQACGVCTLLFAPRRLVARWACAFGDRPS